MELKAEEAEAQKDSEGEKSRKGRIVLLSCLGTVVVFLAAAYIAVAIYYRERFFPGTMINGRNYSHVDKAVVAGDVSNELQEYRLEVVGRDSETGGESSLFIITAANAGMETSLGEADIDALLIRQKEWFWPSVLWQRQYVYTLAGSISVDREVLDAFLDGQPEFQPKNMHAPSNAYIKEYSEAEKCFVLEPEVWGNRLDTDKAKQAVAEALCSKSTILNLDEMGCYENPAVISDNPELQENLNQANRYLETSITYNWNANEVVLDGERIKDWISFEDGKPVLDEEAVAEFVAENAKKFDTYGRTRVFTTTMGIDLKLSRKDFGWKTDRKAEAEALVELIKQGTVGEREPQYLYRTPCMGADDIGTSYVEADLTHQHLYLYQGGELKLETDFVSGNMSNGNETPEGIFGLTYKTTNAVLRGPDYETPVSYWMPFFGDYGMHDATWRSVFGGDIYLTSGSHGCLNLPLDMAKEIYGYMQEGFPIVCYYYPPGVLEPIPTEQETLQTPAPEEGQEIM